MSTPIKKAEWFMYAEDCIEEYCNDWCGEPQDAVYYREMIRDPKERKGEMWECFAEFVNETIDNLKV